MVTMEDITGKLGGRKEYNAPTVTDDMRRTTPKGAPIFPLFATDHETGPDGNKTVLLTYVRVMDDEGNHYFCLVREMFIIGKLSDKEKMLTEGIQRFINNAYTFLLLEIPNPKVVDAITNKPVFAVDVNPETEYERIKKLTIARR